MDVIGGWFSSVSKQLNAAVGYSNEAAAESAANNPASENDFSKTSPNTETEGATEGGAPKEPAQPLLEDVANKALTGAKAFTDSIVTFGKRIVKESAGELKTVLETKSILNELDEENKKFVEEQERQKLLSEAIPAPAWQGCVEETSIKKQILSLSLDSRNFLRDPPAGCDFAFDYEANHSTALAMLNEDPNLRKMRFELVPKQ